MIFFVTVFKFKNVDQQIIDRTISEKTVTNMYRIYLVDSLVKSISTERVRILLLESKAK